MRGMTSLPARLLLLGCLLLFGSAGIGTAVAQDRPRPAPQPEQSPPRRPRRRIRQQSVPGPVSQLRRLSEQAAAETPVPVPVAGPRVALETSMGRIVLELYPDKRR
jgi:hypothetical protein